MSGRPDVPPLATWADLPALALLVALAAASTLLVPGGAPERLVVTTPAGTRTLPLRPGRLHLEGPLGVSVVEVDGAGTARFVRSPCPRQLCVSHGPAAAAGAARVCVPNRVFFELHGPAAGAPRVDGVTQ